MAVRLKDIATDLNLSKMTISKVLRGQTDISAHTKARVLQRVKELNYRPNSSARSLRTGRTLSVGVVVPSLADPFFATIATAIVQAMRSAEYSVLLSSSEGEPRSERSEIEQHLPWQVDALILASRQAPDELRDSAGGWEKPLILIHSGPSSPRFNAVELRERDVGYMAASHLAAIGCRRIANVRGPRSATTDIRFRGFRSALADAGQRFRPELVTETNEEDGSEYRRGRHAAQRLLAGPVVPDGVVCHSDLIALGVIDVAAAAGLDVPRDLAVVGCGNSVEICHMDLSLSSIDLSAAKLGQRAAKLALKLLLRDGTSEVRSAVVSPSLEVRDSTKR